MTLTRIKSLKVAVYILVKSGTFLCSGIDALILSTFTSVLLSHIVPRDGAFIPCSSQIKASLPSDPSIAGLTTEQVGFFFLILGKPRLRFTRDQFVCACRTAD